MAKTQEQHIIELMKQQGALRPKDLVRYDLSRTALLRLLQKGTVERPARGLYVLTENEIPEKQSLIEVAKLVPKAVVCLVSSLRFHELTTQEPHQVWIAMDNKAWHPKVETAALRVIRMTGNSLTYGVEIHHLSGVDVRVFSVAKTVADCFKFRSVVGLDVAIEALRDCWQKKRATMDQLYEAAKVCRMSNVMLPYLEAIT